MVLSTCPMEKEPREACTSQSLHDVSHGDLNRYQDIDKDIERKLEESSQLNTALKRSVNTDETQEDTRSIEQSEDTFSDIINLETPPKATRSDLRSSLHPLQEWEGYVVEINANELVAHLVDLTSADTPFETEEAVIPIEEISQRDRDRMQVGSIFRWVIGYELSPSGTRSRVSQIVFRELPVVTGADLQQGDAWARKIIESFAK